MLRPAALAVALAAVTVVTGVAAGHEDASALPAPRAITLLHHGKTFDLEVGGSVSLRLPNARRSWSQPKASGTGAAAVNPVNYVRDPGFVEWRVAARRPGRVTLASLGRCTACSPRVRRFRVILVVRG